MDKAQIFGTKTYILNYSIYTEMKTCKSDYILYIYIYIKQNYKEIDEKY